MPLYVASLKVLLDPSVSPPEHQTIEKTAGTAEDAKIALANELHEIFFGTAISEDAENNYHDYSTPLGFLDCCRRGCERDAFDSMTATSMWEALNEAYKTLTVEKQENTDGKDSEQKAKEAVCAKSNEEKESPKTKKLNEEDPDGINENKKRKASNISSASASDQKKGLQDLRSTKTMEALQKRNGTASGPEEKVVSAARKEKKPPKEGGGDNDDEDSYDSANIFIDTEGDVADAINELHVEQHFDDT